MDSEQRKRMAEREFVTGEEGDEISYIIRVSGEHTELHRQVEEP